MNIKNKQELDEIIQYERDIYIKKLYPNSLNKNIKNKTLLFMKALRKAEYFKGKSIYKLKYTYWYMIYKLISLITNVSIPLYVFDKGLLNYTLTKHCCFIRGFCRNELLFIS